MNEWFCQAILHEVKSEWFYPQTTAARRFSGEAILFSHHTALHRTDKNRGALSPNLYMFSHIRLGRIEFLAGIHQLRRFWRPAGYCDALFSLVLYLQRNAVSLVVLCNTLCVWPGADAHINAPMWHVILTQHNVPYFCKLTRFNPLFPCLAFFLTNQLHAELAQLRNKKVEVFICYWVKRWAPSGEKTLYGRLR